MSGQRKAYRPDRDYLSRTCRKTNHLNDVLKFDTATQEWRSGFSRPPFEAVAYHTATVVDSEMWVVGGTNAKNTLSGGVHVLDTQTLQWRTVRVRSAALDAATLRSVHLGSLDNA